MPTNSVTAAQRGWRAGVVVLASILVASLVDRPQLAPTSLEAADSCSASQDSVYREGEIVVASPKVWQYERVNALLDGLLRDVESVSLAELTSLNPNKPNATLLQFLQTVTEVGVQVDQAQALKNRTELDNFETTRASDRQRVQTNAVYVQTLLDQRNRLALELTDATNAMNALQVRKSTGALDADGEKQLAAETERVATLKTQLGEVNTLLGASGTSTSLALPNVANTGPPTIPAGGTALSGLKEMLDAFPELKAAAGEWLKSPTYPATKQLQNFMTLLHERLSAEISVMQDDLMRDPSRVSYLLQFDVAMYPSRHGEKRVARVEYQLTDCTDCRVYSIYPAQSAYNIANYEGVSRRSGFVGWVSSLAGVGANATIRRQRDSLQGSLVESVHIAGFQDAASSFGWYYGTAPFEKIMTPGVRSTYAIVSVPRTHRQSLSFCVASSWRKRDARPPADSAGAEHRASISVKVADTESADNLPLAVVGERDRLHVLRMEYSPVYGVEPAAPAPDALSACPRQGCAAVLITLDQPIDPNLVVAVRGRPLRRVRDWRGRATSILPPAQLGPDGAAGTVPKTLRAASPGLTELDALGPDSWFAVNSRELLLNISRSLAGEEFPTITISDPAKRTAVLPNDLRQEFTQVVTGGFRLAPQSRERLRRYINQISGQRESIEQAGRNISDRDRAPLLTGPYPFSTYLPLFLQDRPLHGFYAFYGETGRDVLLGFKGTDGEQAARAQWLASRTQVILEDRDLDFAWSLSCVPQGSYLACALPHDAIRHTYDQVTEECGAEGSRCPALAYKLGIIRHARVIDTLQIWVEQFDPEGDHALGSEEPVALPPFPIDELGRDTRYRPWHFVDYGGQNDRVVIRACNYFSPSLPQITVRLLGDPSRLDLSDPDTDGCRTFPIPGAWLARSHSVLSVEQRSPAWPASQKISYTVAVPNELFRPSFGNPVVRSYPSIERPSTTDIQKTDRWSVDVPVQRATCDMRTDLPGSLQAEWRDGSRRLVSDQDQTQPPSSLCEEWRRAEQAGRLRLHLDVRREALASRPTDGRLVGRVSTTTLATLPNLRKVLLPSLLHVEVIGPEQFVLRGPGAGLIDAVALQDGTTARRFAAAVGANYAVATMSAATELPKPPEFKPLAPGLYTILPLVWLGPKSGYLAVPASGQNGKALLFTQPKPKEKTEGPAQGDTATTATTNTTKTVKTVKKSG